jgi:ABC-type glutathione transport system ATPase component
MRQYPHELSGGMRQRVMIAMAMACGPDLLIADEPTTALDVTVQARSWRSCATSRTRLKTAIVLISHDMGVIAGMADRVLVMRTARSWRGPGRRHLLAPPHDYTRCCWRRCRASTARARGRPHARPSRQGREGGARWARPEGLVPVAAAVRAKPKPLRAVDGVSFTLRQGETLGVVGESGCGKSTLARAVLQAAAQDRPAGWCGSAAISRTPPGRPCAARKDLQIVFQDPLASLDPRMTIGESIAEPLRRSARADRAREVRQGARDDGAGRARAGLDQPLSARILRRPEPARRHRPRHDREAQSW